MSVIDAIASALEGAQATATPLLSLPELDSIDLVDAYRAQHAGFDRRLAAGEKRVGLKLGFTSKAKMIQMGVDDLIVGQLSDSMVLPDGATIDLTHLIHPRVEPEIAFRLGRDVDAHDPLDDIIDAVDAVAPALEIIDSRYEGFSFTLTGVVADNTSAAACVIGPWTSYGSGPVDLANRGVVLHHGGSREYGSTAAILGHPLRTLPVLKSMAARHGFELRRGFIVMAGAATAAVPLLPGVAEARVSGLGRVMVEAAGS